jgi:molybdenum-dependent DNA-binding transcriptional regulator ModE
MEEQLEEQLKEQLKETEAKKKIDGGYKLTPHTLRLLKLITTSSSSVGADDDDDDDDDDHTRHAIAVLSKIASKSHPVLL